MWVDLTVTSPHITPAIIDGNTWEVWKRNHPEMMVSEDEANA